MIIDSCLTDRYKPFPSIFDLMEKCEVRLGKQFSVSTIQKDIKAMKEDEELGYMAPIRYSRSEDGYYYADENYTIKKVPLNSDEIESLEFAAGIL